MPPPLEDKQTDKTDNITYTAPRTQVVRAKLNEVNYGKTQRISYLKLFVYPIYMENTIASNCRSFDPFVT